MSTTDNLYTVAGTSVHKGVKTYRFANNGVKARSRVLQNNGHENVVLYDLPYAMTQADAISWLTGSKATTAPLATAVKATAVKATAVKTATTTAAIAAALNAAHRDTVTDIAAMHND